MEILKSDNKLREEIINDAKNKAERILKKTKQEISELNDNYLETIKKIEQETKENFKKKIDMEIEKILASVNIEVNKKNIKIIGDYIDEVFNELKNSIINNKIIKYQDFMINQIIEAINNIKSENIIIESSKYEIEKIGKENMLKIKLDNFKIIDVIEIDIVYGLKVLSNDRKKMCYISLDNFIENLKKQERLNIYNIFTGNLWKSSSFQ